MIVQLKIDKPFLGFFAHVLGGNPLVPALPEYLPFVHRLPVTALVPQLLGEVSSEV